MNETGIIWTEKTWNPASGCEKISAGCRYCYAFTLAENKRGTPAFPNGFDLTVRPHKLREPLALKEPSLIFVNSMSDLFWPAISDDYRHKVIDIMEQTPQHEYQVLTKRPEEMLRFSRLRPFPGNFWAGVTIENQPNAGRLDTLKKVKAEILFVSAEPLISPLELDLNGIQWLISGGESGGHLMDADTREKRALVTYDGKKWHPRPDRIPWVQSLRDQCQKTKTAFFHKQWGGYNSHSGGRTLDGRTWDEYPRLPVKSTKVPAGKLL
jgi:protein gp37